MKKIYLLLLLSCLCAAGYAQTAASYAFSAFTTPYTSISTTGTSTTALGADDVTQVNIPIGFTFVYCGTSYTKLAACSNGFLSFANTTVAAFTNDAPDMPALGVGCLMVYWDDLAGSNTSGGTPLPSYYSTTGVAPNRIFTFEWKNWLPFWFGGGTGVANFQVKLYETTNIIDFCYGPSTYSSLSATIGIADSTNDWQTLPNVTTSPTPSSVTYTTNLSTSPVVGQVYRWALCMLPSITGTATVCAGATTSLSDSVTGGTWTSSNGTVATVNSSSGVVTGVAAGTSTISYSTGTGCNTAIVVTVNAAPSAITGTASVCVGSTTALTETATGVTWSSSSTGVATVSSTGVVSGVAAGNSTITTTLSTTGCYATKIVTVNAAPSAISGTLNICMGTTSSLTDAVTGGTWTSSTASVATVGIVSGVLTGVAVGTSTITYTAASGCKTTSVATVNTVPSAITGTGATCIGQTTTLSDPTTGGTWSSGSTGVATVGPLTGVVTGVALGTAVITYDPGTGCTATKTVTINALPASISGTASVCVGLTTSLSDALTGGTWSSSTTSVATITAVAGVVTGVSAGTSVITYTAASGCYTTTVVTIVALPAAISGSLGVCIGSTSSLSDASAPGTWASSGTSVATVTADGVVSGLTLGTSTITFTSGSTGCYTTSVATVNALPPAITGTLTVCQGLTTTLADGSAGGTWSSGSTDIATVGASTGVVTGLTGGFTSVITYTAATGCTATAVVSVNVIPNSITGIPRVCVGSTTNLFDATNGGTWSISTVGIGAVEFTTGVVTGVGAGVTTVSYILPSGCYATTPVTVNPLPAAITGALNVCIGQNTTLNDATTGGTWMSGTGSVAAVSGLGGVVTGMGAGTSIITYTSTLNCIINAVVTVHALPDVITGSLAICQGFTTTLSDDSTGGTWSSSAVTIATIDSTTGIATGVAGGTTTITYKLPTGCTATKILTVNSLPSAITGTASVCMGLTTTLTDASGTGTWSSSNTGVATISSAGVVSGVSQGTSTVTFVLPTGCQITTVVTVNPLPSGITGPGIVCAGLTTTLSDASAPGTWSSSAMSIATVGATTGIVTGIVGGTSTITFSLPTGCIATTTVTIDPVPAAITGTLSICAGLTTSLGDATSSGTWSSSNTTVATVDVATGVVTANSAGTTTITYALGTGCIETAVVTVNPLPGTISGIKSVCGGGSTTTLTDAPLGGTWSSSSSVATAGLLTGIITGVTTGTSVITYTLATGCIRTTIVTVNLAPVAITGASQVCVGLTTTLSDATASGTWSSSNASIASVGAATGIVTGASTGSATIAYILSDGCSATIPMTVHPLPATISGPSSVCAAGGTITLSDASSGGTWSSSSTGIATVDATTGIVTGVTAGVATITYTLPTSCIATATVTVNPVATAVITPLSDTTFCPGGFVMLTANTGSGLTYMWYDNGVFISGAVTSTYLANASGSYQVKVTNDIGCPITSTPMIVTVDTPIATITVLGGGSGTICSGSPVTLDANTGVGYSYQWLVDGVPISGAVSNSYTTLIAGDYSVIVTNSTGCSATSAVLTVAISPSPSATITLSGPLTFCQNDSVVLSVPAGNTYQWYSLSGGAIVGATDSSFTITTAGNYWVVVSNTYGCSSTSVNNVVVVNPLPDVTITPGGPTIFCAGGSVTLGAVTATGLTYQWYDNGIVISGATDSSYVATTSGGYRVQVTDGATGCTDRTHADTVVTQVTTPIVIPMMPTSFCWGGSCLLSTSVSGAAGTVTYQWYKDGVSIAGASGSTYNATQSGAYACAIMLTGSCTLTTASVLVTENPLPNPVITYSGTTLSTATYFTSYQWYKDLTSISGANTFSTAATGDGNYKVAVTDTNGCQSFSDVYVVAGWGTTGVGNVKKGEVRIYPNPAHDMIHVESAGDVRVMISGVDGRMLIDQIAKDIDISGLADGIYMIMVYDTTGTMLKTDKLLKASK